jgi:DNA polymerase-3 subunit gamma/tau
VGQALYRKYRSKKLSEIVGQEHITRTLQSALDSGKISHAYLFTGPKGVGKTSIARILAHELNNLTYTDESIHLDIIEIDAASNRRIDEIRDLRDKVHIAPTSAKYKIYIIDEVHMLTKEAFNALLKTLEEPPAHVIFILATTELHKLPETIISRTQRFTFKPIDEQDAVSHLRTIADAEGITIDDEALRLLAIHGGGSFRDSISLLDQVGSTNGKITRADAEQLVGIAANEHIQELLTTTFQGTPADIVTSLQRLIEDGITPAQTAKQMARLIRQQLVDGQGNKEHLDLLSDLLEVPVSPEPSAQLEIILLKQRMSANTPRRETSNNTKATPPRQKLDVKEPPAAKEPTLAQSEDQTSAVTNMGTPAEWWSEVLTEIKAVNNTLYGVLRMAEAKVEGDILRLRFGFGLHKKKVDETATQAKLQEAVQQVTGKVFTIEAIHDKSMQTSTPTLPQTIPTPQTDTSAGLSSITNIFGGGEVLES